ncbi:hypothetical protein G647_02792 [Cladophialophora carrionii CBS 160.54]|uniref:DNA2/NAM7 helicase-like C-terminal domain-containing protein n=1 Tax=Cladophialophora carrionii CBS 160.54 TaxID=1279043 RepID=V9DGP0_9EURO|nr:uncharacterized protein G647_02792 [Cladophialophora carrionii CBS 160.54]ETI26015.1 hypothetical protein G647_02792 [Cladophialophora carrionii CBS 160.54]
MAMIRAYIPPGPDGLLPERVSASILSPDPRPPLSFTDDGPGRLSQLGPRHNNDHDDFRKIKILPTPDEILAVDRPVYMPKKDLIQKHFLDNGPGRHLDTLFRQLRCDSTEMIRDICYSAAQIAFLKTGIDSEAHVRQETNAGHRYFLYRNIKVQELLSHEHKSMVVRVSYDCPPFMRGRKLYDAGHFQRGMLVALLQLNNTTMEFSVYYMEVSLAQTTFSMDAFDGRGTQAAVQLSFLPPSSHDDILQLCRHALRLKTDNELYLVEFPKVLFAGFYNCLKCLQDMKDSDFAFSQYVAPRVHVEDALLARELNSAVGLPPYFPCLPPSYARAPDFKYNLAKIVGPHSPITSVSLEDLCQPSTLDILKRETTLDEGQAVAFRDSLIRDFACTQGPPGCGKSYLGLKVAQAVLESRTAQKPVLLVCLTNHALDNFLADLRDAGVFGLLRVGSGSKEEWTDSINIRGLRRKTRFKREESNVLHTHALQKKESLAGLDELCKGTTSPSLAEQTRLTSIAVSCQTHTGVTPWHYVRDVLCSDHQDIHAQFTTTAKVSLAQSFTFEYWSAGGDLETIRDLHLELATRLAQVSASHDKRPEEDVDKLLFDLSWDAELRSFSAGLSSIWNMPLAERQSLIKSWEKQVNKEALAQKMMSLYLESQHHEREIERVQNERDGRIMAAHNIIAMTTTACAARWEVLRSLDLQILICEEAAEVMEAHTLCSLLPSLEHAIFIGDPQQLRPEANEQMLSLESRVGRQYRLDESLLERLMMPQDVCAYSLPASHLSVQRRMHPQIADITRLTYPYLEDHESTHVRSPVQGLAQRMFWWDHRIPELESDDLKSHANLHEVEMVASLVEYLLRRGAYEQAEIAVLTPYAGQLLRLYKRLGATCDIWLSEKDRAALLEEEVLALGEEGRTTKDEVVMSNMLRIATVDNFQGQEAKVIILSTVRSGGKAGFLKTLNRINVACSRARNGEFFPSTPESSTLHAALVLWSST